MTQLGPHPSVDFFLTGSLHILPFCGPKLTQSITSVTFLKPNFLTLHDFKGSFMAVGSLTKQQRLS